MRRHLTAGIAALAGVWVASIGAGSLMTASAQEISDNAVQTLMDYAWSLTPDRFTKPDGVVVEVDRNNRKATEVPMEAAREVIKAGRLSAHAQTCDLKEEQAANYRGFMLKESSKKKWTEQQMLYMNQLHLVTVMLLTGKLKVTESQEGKVPEVVEDGNKTDLNPKSCTDEQRAKVKETILAFLKTVPLPTAPKAAAGGSAPPATPAAAAPGKK